MMLRDVVYDYLWKQIKDKQFMPGAFVDLNFIAKRLNVSRTPLREAFIILENEGFVVILPKKGIYIKPLTLQDTHYLYEIIGSLESAIVMNEWSKINPEHIETMEGHNEEMGKCTDHAQHYEMNRKFHFIYIQLSENQELRQQLSRLYQRIYDFSGMNYGRRFQQNNCNGHREFIHLLKKGKRLEAADYLRDTHWKFRAIEAFTGGY